MCICWLVFCLFLVRQPPPPFSVGQEFHIHEVSRSHTTTHYSQQDSSGRVISSSQRPLPENIQHSQQKKKIHSPDHLIRLDFITRTILGKEYRSLSSSLCSFLYSFVTSSLLGPNILLNTQFSNTFSLCNVTPK